jgi:hypothetical protein
MVLLHHSLIPRESDGPFDATADFPEVILTLK